MVLFGGQNHVTSVQRGGGLEHLIMLGPMKTVQPPFRFSISVHWKSVVVFFLLPVLPLENACSVFVVSHIFTSF